MMRSMFYGFSQVGLARLFGPALGNWIVGGLVVLLLSLAAANLLRDRRKGKGGCVSCSGCSRSGCPAARQESAANEIESRES